MSKTTRLLLLSSLPLITIVMIFCLPIPPALAASTEHATRNTFPTEHATRNTFPTEHATRNTLILTDTLIDISNSTVLTGLHFPFQRGQSALYGPLGVHQAWGDLPGWVAIDLLSGSDYGETAASDLVYAMEDSVITWVCSDGTSKAFRAGNLIYAHLTTSSDLQVGQVIRQNEAIGWLKHGTFDDDCGYSTQDSDHWHLHLGFPPGQLCIERWCISAYGTNAATPFYSGSETVAPGEMLTAEWDSSNIQPAASENFWDAILTAIESLGESTAASFPNHQNLDISVRMIQYTSLPVRIINQIVMLNFGFTFFALNLILTLEIVRSGLSLLRWIKSIIPFA